VLKALAAGWFLLVCCLLLTVPTHCKLVRKEQSHERRRDWMAYPTCHVL
jgi:hypothetical protein